MVMCFPCFLLIVCLECDSEEVWALRTLFYSSGEACFSLNYPLLARASLRLGARLYSSSFLPRAEWICNLWLVPMPYSEFLYSEIFVGRQKGALG